MRLRIVREDVSDGAAVLAVEEQGRRLHPSEYHRRRLAIAKYILEERCTQRQAAGVFGINQSNVSRALAGWMGAPFGDLPEVYAENRKLGARYGWTKRKGRDHGGDLSQL